MWWWLLVTQTAHFAATRLHSACLRPEQLLGPDSIKCRKFDFRYPLCSGRRFWSVQTCYSCQHVGSVAVLYAARNISEFFVLGWAMFTVGLAIRKAAVTTCSTTAVWPECSRKFALRQLCFVEFLGAFAKLRRVSVCPSVSPRAATRPPTGRIFMKFDIWVFFRKCAKKNLSVINLLEPECYF